MLGAWDKNVGAGGNMSSKLAQRVAVNGLCNSYMAFNTNYHDTGLFGVYAVADKHQPVSHACCYVSTDSIAASDVMLYLDACCSVLDLYLLLKPCRCSCSRVVMLAPSEVLRTEEFDASLESTYTFAQFNLS